MSVPMSLFVAMAAHSCPQKHLEVVGAGNVQRTGMGMGMEENMNIK